jgi:uncharacterized protein (TIGR03083 family)
MSDTGKRIQEAHSRLVRQLEEQAADVRRLTAELGEDDLARRTVPEKWSLKELVCHLWRVQQVFVGRLEAMLSEEEPTLAPYQPEGDAEFERMAQAPAAESLQAFEADRERLTERLQDLTPGEWRRRGRHPEYQSYDVRFLVEYLAHHEAHHIYQMFQRRAPFGSIPH